MTEKEINEVKKLLESHEPFYVKLWQSNGYYPIDKFHLLKIIYPYVKIIVYLKNILQKIKQVYVNAP